MITRWIGKEFDLIDGDHVTVTACYMAPSRWSVCLVLQSRHGELYLTTRELEMAKA